MDFITIPLTVGLVAFFIYKFFELLICRRERLTIVDRIDTNAMIEYLKQVRMGVNIGNFARSESLRLSYPASWSLRIGCLVFGMGLGLILGTFMDRCMFYNTHWGNSREIVFGGSMLCLGGLGLLVAFIVEYSLYRKACKEGKK